MELAVFRAMSSSASDETFPETLFRERENFFKLIDKKQPLITTPLQVMNEPPGGVRFGVEKLPCLGLIEPTAVQRTSERFERIHIRHENEIAEPRAY